MIDVSIFGVSAVVLVGILTETYKKAGITTNYIPLASLISGILVICLGTWTLSVEAVVSGIIIGAIASGIYDNISKGTEVVKKLI